MRFERIGHYDVTALIGEGGMGQVYQATDTKLNRHVALKILLPEAFAADLIDSQDSSAKPQSWPHSTTRTSVTSTAWKRQRVRRRWFWNLLKDRRWRIGSSRGWARRGSCEGAAVRPSVLWRIDNLDPHRAKTSPRNIAPMAVLDESRQCGVTNSSTQYGSARVGSPARSYSYRCHASSASE